jgi:hypothetical protein
MHFKVFIQARKEADASGNPAQSERMFSYNVNAENSEQAVASARQRFELEHGLEGWGVEGVGVVQMP